MVTPEPAKGPRASDRRFRYPDPNGCWQLDGFEYRLDDQAGSKRCVLQVEDDHSRFILASHVALSETGEAAITVVAGAIGRHGAPARFLTDNGTAFNQSRRGKTSHWSPTCDARVSNRSLAVPASPPPRARTSGYTRTIQKFLDANRPIRTGQRLTELVEEFEEYYNTQRAHQSLEPDQPPAETLCPRLDAVIHPVQSMQKSATPRRSSADLSGSRSCRRSRAPAVSAGSPCEDQESSDHNAAAGA